MKRTLIITLEFPPSVGGIATYVDDLAGALNPAQTIVLAPVVPGMAAWDATRKYTIIRKKLLLPSFLWPRWLALWWHVRKVCKEREVERIIVHHMLPAGYVAMRMKRTMKISFIVFSHGTDFVLGTATPHKTRMTKMVLRAADMIICNSQSLKSRLLQKLPMFIEKTTVLYPCPDVFFTQPVPTQKIAQLQTMYGLEGKKVLLSVSRLVDGKGFAHLLRIMPELLKHNPNLVWFIAGDGEKRTKIMDMIRERNLQNIVRFIGQVPHEELAVYYHLADLFVLLTHPFEGREEGLGLVFLEAAAAGLPVVAGASGGVAEAVIDGETGYVVDTEKELDVINSITLLLDNEQKRLQFSRAAQARVQSTFVWENQLENILPWLN